MQATQYRLHDPYLRDGLEGLGVFDIAAVIGAGLDYLGAKKQLDAQKDALTVQLQAAEKAREVAQLQLQAAQAQRETAALEASAQQKLSTANVLGFGLDVNKLILPLAIGGGALLLFMTMRGRGRRRRR